MRWYSGRVILRQAVQALANAREARTLRGACEWSGRVGVGEKAVHFNGADAAWNGYVWLREPSYPKSIEQIAS